MSETPNPVVPPEAKPWFDGMEADFVGHLQNRGWDKLDPKGATFEAIKAYRNAEAKLGAPPDELHRFPKLPDDPAWKDVWASLGTPATAEEYDFSSAKFADGTSVNDDVIAAMRPAFLTANMTVDQAAVVAKAIAAFAEYVESNQAGERAAIIAKEQDDLQKDWGPRFHQNRQVAEQAAKKLGFEPNFIAELMDQQGAGLARTMEAFRRIGVIIGEDKFVSGDNGSQAATRGQARDMLNSLKSDRAWVQRLNANDPATVREFNNLTEVMAREL